MGWIALALVGLAAAAGLWALGLSRRLWSLSGAVLMLGATGYALQGKPTLPAHPVKAESAAIAVDPGLAPLREALFAASREDVLALATADNRVAAGDARAAAQGLARDLQARPTSAALWAGFGYVLTIHDGAISPSAKLAYQRALRLAPRSPGPPFLLGMSYVEGGQIDAARASWVEALRRTPTDVPYRREIALRIMAIDQFEQMNAAKAR